MPARATGLPGAHLTREGCEFRLPAPRAKAVELVLLDADMHQRTFPRPSPAASTTGVRCAIMCRTPHT